MGELIYRVQDADGRGPWRPGFSHKWTEDRTDAEYAALLPWPIEFPGLVFGYGYHGCGCQSLAQLRRWIRQSEYATLQRYGYRAVAIEVDRILARSAVQCVFERRKPLNQLVCHARLYSVASGVNAVEIA